MASSLSDRDIENMSEAEKTAVLKLLAKGYTIQKNSKTKSSEKIPRQTFWPPKMPEIPKKKGDCPPYSNTPGCQCSMCKDCRLDAEIYP